jgi:hypothetical protein
MVDNSYFQFPLCALSFGQTVNARLNAILDYSVVEAGQKLFQKLTAEQQREFLRGKNVSRTNPNGLNPRDWRQCAACYGANIIGVTYYGINSIIERHGQLRKFVADYEGRHGRDALVRIKKDWLFDARDGHGISYREFSVLCAIYSAIGDKELAIITRERIRRCALGYRTAAIMQAELAKRTDNVQLLTERQLRDTIARLHHNKFFARCTVARRITYYSIRLDNEAMRKKVVERRTYPAFFHASQSAQDATLTAAIKQRRREAAKSELKTPPLAPRFKFTLPGDAR